MSSKWNRGMTPGMTTPWRVVLPTRCPKTKHYLARGHTILTNIYLACFVWPPGVSFYLSLAVRFKHALFVCFWPICLLVFYFQGTCISLASDEHIIRCTCQLWSETNYCHAHSAIRYRSIRRARLCRQSAVMSIVERSAESIQQSVRWSAWRVKNQATLT